MQQWTWLRGIFNFKNALSFFKNSFMLLQKTSSFFTQRKMSTISENRVEPFTWLEFISDTESVHNFWLYHHANRELREEIEEPHVNDEQPDKTEVLNLLGSFRCQPPFTRGHVLRGLLDTMYNHRSVEDLGELRTVSNTLRGTIVAAQSRQYIFPHKDLTRAEMRWQTETAEACQIANEWFSDKAAEKKGNLPKLVVSQNTIVPHRNDEVRQKWHRTDDCGGWMHDDGTMWEETEHNGMLPYDEEGDTEEEELETVNINDLSEEEARRSVEAHAALHGL